MDRSGRGLALGADGIWRSGHAVQVSYPHDGSGCCFDVEESSFWFHHRNRVILDTIVRLVPRQGERILDIGGGNGFVARALLQAGYSVTLLEPSEEGARNARARGLPDVICAAFDPALFATGEYAVATLFDVVEHIESDVPFLRDVGATLGSGGLVVLTLPAFQFLFSEEDSRAGHFRRYTRRSAAAALRAAGFEPLRFSYFMAPLVAPVFVLRTLPGWLGWRRQGAEREAQREHAGASLLGRIAAGSLAIEAGLLRRGLRMPFGSSCIVVARAR